VAADRSILANARVQAIEQAEAFQTVAVDNARGDALFALAFFGQVWREQKKKKQHNGGAGAPPPKETKKETFGYRKAWCGEHAGGQRTNSYPVLWAIEGILAAHTRGRPRGHRTWGVFLLFTEIKNGKIRLKLRS
jgi:hypothetical protein